MQKKISYLFIKYKPKSLGAVYAHFLINSFMVYKKRKMKKHPEKKYLNKDEVNELIESALRRHNRRSTIISSVLGWILIGGYSFGLFQAVQNV